MVVQQQVTGDGGIITIIHFVSEMMVPPDEEGPPVPQWRIVCMPNMTEFGETAYHQCYRRTDDARAATCPACKRSPEYKQYMERLGVATKK